MRRLFKNTGHLLFRVWFYVLTAAPVILFAPILFLLLAHPRGYRPFYWMARNLWAAPILYGMACPPRTTGPYRLPEGRVAVWVANHTSMLDIMLMLRMVPEPFVFVGKAELARIPLFGALYRRSMVLVDRSDLKSRKAVYHRVGPFLKQGIGVALFPEGGVPDESVQLDAFKDGAFSIAIAHGLPLVPMTFYDGKRRFSWTFFSGGPGPLRVRVHPVIETQEMTMSEVPALRERVRAAIAVDLSADPFQKR